MNSIARLPRCTTSAAGRLNVMNCFGIKDASILVHSLTLLLSVFISEDFSAFCCSLAQRRMDVTIAVSVEGVVQYYSTFT